MEVIFVVMGHAGLHDDYRTWMAKGFKNKSDAELYQLKCIDEANRIIKEINTLEKERFTFTDDRLPEVADPISYLADVQAIIDSNKVDDYFEHDQDIDYTIDALEVE